MTALDANSTPTTDDALLILLMEIRQRIEAARRAGCTQIVINQRHAAEAIAAHFVDSEYEED